MGARSETDRLLTELERKLTALYSRAAKEIQAKWDRFAKEQRPKIQKAYDELQAAKQSGDYKAINAAKAEYERVVRNATLGNSRYKALIDETTTKLANVNKIALGYVNDNLAQIYLLNYNAFDDSMLLDYDFTLMNEEALKSLVNSNSAFLPTKTLNVAKDMAWNEKAINSQLFQGILQGESIDKIALRLMAVTDMNWKAAIRNARTMFTAAENQGRYDSMKKASKDGVIVYKRWVAMHDEKTRDAHRELDGVEIPWDEPFVNSIGPIMKPADPAAAPANVYNCRCGMRSVIKGFKWRKLRDMFE